MNSEGLQDYSDSISGGTEDQVWSSNSQTSSEDNLSWISWWCAHAGHEFFAEVPEDFIEDDFNMTGLSSVVELYREALELILDLEAEDEAFGAADQEDIEAASEQLYGLIHQRYICSRNGLVAMAEKYESGHFGICPRTLCGKAAVLPIGLSDVMEEESVKLYCPLCKDVYNPPNSRFNHIDGSYFGTTFPHLFFMNFPELLPRFPKGSPITYQPRMYGFRISKHARTGPKMAWLRYNIQSTDKTDTEEEGSDSEPDNGDRWDQGEGLLVQHAAGTDPSPAAGASKGAKAAQPRSATQSNSRGQTSDPMVVDGAKASAVVAVRDTRVAV